MLVVRHLLPSFLVRLCGSMKEKRQAGKQGSMSVVFNDVFLALRRPFSSLWQ